MIDLQLGYFLPEYHFAKKSAVIVRAPAERVFAAVKDLDFSGSRVIRILFRLRGAYGFLFHWRKGEMSMEKGPRSLQMSLRALVNGSGFVLLDEVANRELVLGLVGKFWKPSAGIVAGLDASRFLDFRQEIICEKYYWLKMI